MPFLIRQFSEKHRRNTLLLTTHTFSTTHNTFSISLLTAIIVAAEKAPLRVMILIRFICVAPTTAVSASGIVVRGGSEIATAIIAFVKLPISLENIIVQHLVPTLVDEQRNIFYLLASVLEGRCIR